MNWTCPHCDSINSEYRMRCACGHEITEEKKQKHLGVDIVTPPDASDVPFQSAPIPPAVPRHVSKLRRAFWISLGVIMLAIVFLFLAYNYPQLILGSAPIASKIDPQSDYGSAIQMANELKALNYWDNTRVLKKIAEAAVFWTSIAGLILFFLVRKEEKRH